MFLLPCHHIQKDRIDMTFEKCHFVPGVEKNEWRKHIYLVEEGGLCC